MRFGMKLCQLDWLGIPLSSATRYVACKNLLNLSKPVSHPPKVYYRIIVEEEIPCTKCFAYQPNKYLVLINQYYYHLFCL